MSCCGVGSEAMSQGRSDNGQIRRNRGEDKSVNISGTISPIYFKLAQCMNEGMPYH